MTRNLEPRAVLLVETNLVAVNPTLAKPYLKWDTTHIESMIARADPIQNANATPNSILRCLKMRWGRAASSFWRSWMCENVAKRTTKRTIRTTMRTSRQLYLVTPPLQSQQQVDNDGGKITHAEPVWVFRFPSQNWEQPVFALRLLIKSRHSRYSNCPDR